MKSLNKDDDGIDDAPFDNVRLVWLSEIFGVAQEDKKYNKNCKLIKEVDYCGDIVGLSPVVHEIKAIINGGSKHHPKGPLVLLVSFLDELVGNDNTGYE